MKKLFLVVAAVVAASVSSANAQVVWGVRVGASIPSVSGDGGEDSYGLEIGPTLYYSLQNNLYINSGAMFNQKKFNWKDAFSSTWVEIPLYLGYAIPIGGVQTYAQVGPYFGLKLSESYTPLYDYDAIDKDIFSSFNAGLGIMYGINIKKFKIEAGYQYGLTNVLQMYDDDNKLNALFVGVSYVF
ncbi:hypothetical protein AGMMS49965_11250 [Bacteroidia bacterium]|nr:hypothetical protein AGMMS49965_11250 [Bacteroidia bacterium]